VGVGRLSYRHRLWVLAATVALVGIVVHLRALANGFTNWDDPGYVVENSHLGPLDARFLAWAFTTFQQGNWHPLTWLSLAVDHALFGVDPLGYHLSNVLLHGVTALTVVLLVGALFDRALGACDGRGLVAAAVAGLVFAVHPLHVESVAWVSERKDVLCGFFYVFAVLSYLRFAEHHSRAKYLASLGAFALALLAKPMAVSLPLVLLILDAYPLARLTRPGWTRVVVEKVPFVALGIASSVVTIVAQSRAGAVLTMQYVGLGSRLWGAQRALGFYLAKTVLPIDLVPVYPLEHGVSPWRWDFLLSLTLVLGATATVVVLRRRAPLVGALCASYLVMLLPVLGLVQVGEQAAADRYMYLPLLAPAIGLAALSIHVWQGGRHARTALTATVLVAVAGLSVLTVRQIGVWRDTPTLWAWVVEKQPGVALAHYNLGEYLRKKGDPDGAARCWRRAVEIEPSFSWPLNGLGNLAELRGALDEARSYFERATRANMYDAASQYNFATFLEDQGQAAEARVHYEIFLRVAPPKLSHLFPEVQAKLSLLARP
jgi:protein O-mannosyl-transferase